MENDIFLSKKWFYFQSSFYIYSQFKQGHINFYETCIVFIKKPFLMVVDFLRVIFFVFPTEGIISRAAALMDINIMLKILNANVCLKILVKVLLF